MTHTIGPWKPLGSRVLAPNVKHTVTRAHPVFVVAQCGTYTSPKHDEMISNVTLIAAAPELLAALQHVSQCVLAECEDDMDIELVFAAIAKATGA